MRAFAIGGPTASGKTALALELAERFDAVVLCADAMTVYRGMDIGSAKPPVAERRGIRHFGLDVVDPDEPFDAADFLALAHRVLATHPRVIVVGGTSLYLRSLRRGLVETPAPDPALRERLVAEGRLHERLARVDPELAARLHPNDAVRIVRGLEVFEATGRKLSALQAEHAAQPDAVELPGIWLDREDLDERIDGRVLSMMDAGYLDEVRALLERYPRDLKPMRSLGYRHLADHLLDGLELAEAIRRTQRDTRRFARKQRTWAKHLGLDADVARAAEVLGTPASGPSTPEGV